MRILVLGDSLPFPRPLKGQPLPATWPELLAAQIPGLDVWQRAKPRGSMLDVKRELEFFTDSLDHFDALIIQAGIVDCAPRPYPYWAVRMLEALLSPAAFRRVERFTHQYFLWLYGRQWVNPRLFARTLLEVVQLANERNAAMPILFLAIAPPNRSILANLPGIDASALHYNRIMTDAIGSRPLPTAQVKVLNPYAGAEPLEVTIDDGHHLSTRGHELVAASILRALEFRPEAHPATSSRPMSVGRYFPGGYQPKPAAGVIAK